jgi:hypothetical protein
LNRLITTFDEVPPYLSPAIHIADDDGVTFKTCTAEVFRPIPNVENRSFQVFEIRKDSAVHVSLSSSSLVKQPGVRRPQLPRLGGSGRPHSTANDNRWIPAVDSLISMRSFTGTKTCLGQEPRQCRAQWSGYRPAQSVLSTPVVNKSSHRLRESCGRKKSR